MSFIDKQTLQVMNVRKISDMVKLCSELGVICKKGSSPYTVGKEQELRKEYKLIARLSERLAADKAFSLSLHSCLENINNITNLTESLAASQRVLEADEIFEVKQFSYYAEKIRCLLRQHNLVAIVKLPSLEKLFTALDPEKLDSPVFSISSAYSAKLSSFRADRLKLQREIKRLKNLLLQEAKKKINLVSPETCIVVSRANQELLDRLYKSGLYYISAENFANVTFSLKKTDALIKTEKDEQMLKEKIDEEEENVRASLTRTISAAKSALLKSLSGIGKLDYMRAKTVFGIENNCIIPDIEEPDSGKIISFQGAVNIPLKIELHSQHIDYQPVDIYIDGKVNVITGANMAGKTTLLETIGQMMYLIANAIPVPCEKAFATLTDMIFTNRAFSQNRSDLSSFASELVALNDALRAERKKGLFLLDEFANGTNPVEGEAFASGILEYFSDNNDCEDIVIAATHFTLHSRFRSNEGGMQAAHFRIAGISDRNYEKLKATLSNDDFKEKKGVSERIGELHKYMDYRLQRVDLGDAPPRAAVMIAEILGVDGKILKKVKAKLKTETGC